ncbi:SEA (Seh1-associated) complex subunit [Lecanora helva]
MSTPTHEHAGAPSPPPPPPLPPQRQGFVANALARVAQPFGYGSRPSSATGHRSNGPRPSRLSIQRSSRWAPKPSLRPLVAILPKVPEVPQEECTEAQADVELSPISSQSTSHKTGIPIAALDISPDRTHAVLAGRNILKTIEVSETTCTEDVNIKADVIAYAATHKDSRGALSYKHKDQWAANDVKWSHGQYDSTIATAVANGQIVVYDINRPGLEVARLHEHTRLVHRLNFNPYHGHLMLSGSQDGTIRLWDLRSLSTERSVTTCYSRSKYPGNSGSIRDLKWSPANAMEFALGTDTGILQRWDFRNERTPLLRVNAHDTKACLSIDWHPHGKYLVSGGKDKNIKVWDFSSSDRRKKSVWEIRAPDAVTNVRWRPACWSTARTDPARWQSTQIAVSYEEDPRIHVWDFRRPCLPFRYYDRYETSASALMWHSEHLLWSVGSAGMFTQIDMNFVPMTMDHLSPNTLAVAADGQILFFSQKREQKGLLVEDIIYGINQKKGRQDIGSDERRASSSIRHSSSKDHTALVSSSFQSRHNTSSSLTRPAKSSVAIAPFDLSAGQVQDLAQSLQPENMYSYSQLAGIGSFKGLSDPATFVHFAHKYKIPQIPTEDTDCNLNTILRDALQHNAAVAQEKKQYRLAQTWRVLAHALGVELRERAELSLQKRLALEKALNHSSIGSAESIKSAATEETGKQPLEEASEHAPKTTNPASQISLPEPAQQVVQEFSPGLQDDASSHEAQSSENLTSHYSSALESLPQQASEESHNVMDSARQQSVVPTKQASETVAPRERPRYRRSDFNKLPRKPEHLPPWYASEMFGPLLDYHVFILKDVQTSSWWLLHLGPWLYHNIPEGHILPTLLDYHQQLVDNECFIPAASLRKLCYTDWPEVSEEGLNDITPGGPWCVDCKQPSKGGRHGFCERCHQRWAECAVCEGDGPIQPPNEMGACHQDRNPGAGALWYWCQDCGHGGHVACLKLFWDADDDEGACPTSGCFHDCLPGKRRDEIFAKMEKEQMEQQPRVVSQDEWRVPESAAAQRARNLVGGSSSGGAGGDAGVGGVGRRGGLAAAGRSGSGGRRVRIVAPGEEETGESSGDRGEAVEMHDSAS